MGLPVNFRTEFACSASPTRQRVPEYIGLDVSLAKTSICVANEHGKIVKETQIASEPEALVRWIREQDGTIAAIGPEADPLVAVAASRADRSGLGRRADGNPAGERGAQGNADQVGSE